MRQYWDASRASISEKHTIVVRLLNATWDTDIFEPPHSPRIVLLSIGFMRLVSDFVYTIRMSRGRIFVRRWVHLIICLNLFMAHSSCRMRCRQKSQSTTSHRKPFCFPSSFSSCCSDLLLFTVLFPSVPRAPLCKPHSYFVAFYGLYILCVHAGWTFFVARCFIQINEFFFGVFVAGYGRDDSRISAARAYILSSSIYYIY